MLAKIREELRKSLEERGDEKDEEEGAESANNWEGRVTLSEFESVDWMYMNVSKHAEPQSNLRWAGVWEDYHVRPPLMRFEGDLEHASGFWRRS